MANLFFLPHLRWYRQNKMNLDWKPGDMLPTITKKLTPEKITRYAQVSGDHNPIHTDEEFASNTPFKGTIAHGMLLLAYVSQLLAEAFGTSWYSRGKLSLRFKAPAYTTDVVAISGEIESIENNGYNSKIICLVSVHNQEDKILINGTAEIMEPKNE